MKTRPHILVIDADKKSSTPLVSILSSHGYGVFTSLPGNDVTALVDSHQADLILMSADGISSGILETVRSLKTGMNTRYLPVIIYSRSDDPEIRSRCADSGCDDILVLPLEDTSLLTTVYTHIQISHCRPLLNEKESVRNILDHIAAGILIMDPSLAVTHISPRAVEMLGLAGEVAGTSVIDHMDTNFKTDYKGDLRKDIKETELSFEMENVPGSGAEPLIISVKSGILRNPLGEKSGIMLRMEDVTDERREESLKREFLSLISHKLRTPVTLITQGASMLNEGMAGELNDKQKKLLRTVLDKANMLQQLVEKLLGFNEIDRDLLRPGEGHIDLKEYLTGGVSALIGAPPGKEITLDVDCPPNTYLNINDVCLDVIMANLLDNSVKFNDKDKLHIRICAERTDNAITIHVSDNGPGIPFEEREKVFRKFYQLERYFTGNVSGAGLGLSAVRHLVEACGGTIRIGASEDKGTDMVLTFPVPASS